MRAGVLHGIRDLRLEDVPVPSRGPDEVLIRIVQNGICGSDVHFYEDGRLGPFEVTRPYIPGHEACGIVVEASEYGGGPPVGQRVAIEPGIPCRRCEWCKKGRYNLCPEVVFLSAPPVNGTFAEYVALPADFAHAVPDTVSDEEAAFVEPISVALQAANRAGLSAGMSVAVLGAGPIGLVTSMIARVFGAVTIYQLDRVPARLATAEEVCGATGLNVDDGDPTRRLLERTGGLGVDVVFDASGNSRASAMGPLIAKRGGVVVLIGWPEIDPVPFPIEQVLEKELDVRGVNRYCNTYPQAMELLGKAQLDVGRLISHRFELSQIAEAIAFASANRQTAIKVMVSASAR